MTIISVQIQAANYDKIFRSYDYANTFKDVDEFLIDYLHRDMEYWKTVDVGSILLSDKERKYRAFDHKRLLSLHWVGKARV